MGVTANQFVTHSSRDFIQIKLVVFVRQFSVKNNLEKKVAQFLLQVLLIARANGGDGFVSFFDQIGNERFVGLFCIPRTASGGP